MGGPPSPTPGQNAEWHRLTWADWSIMEEGRPEDGAGPSMPALSFHTFGQIQPSTATVESVRDEMGHIMPVTAPCMGGKCPCQVHRRSFVCLRSGLPSGQVPTPVWAVDISSGTSRFPEQKLRVGHFNKEQWGLAYPESCLRPHSTALCSLSIFSVTSQFLM